MLSVMKVRLEESDRGSLTFIALNITQHDLKSVISSDSHIYLAAIGLKGLGLNSPSFNRTFRGIKCRNNESCRLRCS